MTATSTDTFVTSTGYRAKQDWLGRFEQGTLIGYSDAERGWRKRPGGDEAYAAGYEIGYGLAVQQYEYDLDFMLAEYSAMQQMCAEQTAERGFDEWASGYRTGGAATASELVEIRMAQAGYPV
jgi:hypothetical protein